MSARLEMVLCCRPGARRIGQERLDSRIPPFQIVESAPDQDRRVIGLRLDVD
jgi:hypothetical protein